MELLHMPMPNTKSIQLRKCHLMPLVLDVIYTKTLHTKDDIKQREERQKHPDFLFTHKLKFSKKLHPTRSFPKALVLVL